MGFYEGHGIGPGHQYGGVDLPMPVSTGAIPAGTKITHIAADAYDQLAVSSDGQIYTWGFNNFGQLGDDGSRGGSLLPVAVSLPTGAAIQDVAPGPDAEHVLTLATISH